jgi:signal transduction histidine kinase
VALAEAWTAVAPRDSSATDWPRIAVKPGFRTVALGNDRFAALHPFWRDVGAPVWEDVAIVPVVSSGHAFGELTLYLPGGRALPEDDQAYLVALADQAAVAVQNSALLAEATRSAGASERQRLARELHDSVSQCLFSMTLHGRAAERHLAGLGVTGEHPAVREVTQLRELTAGALAEMRALIFELRPGALAEEGLVAALRKQATAVTARTQTPVEVDASTERVELDPLVEEHLYRLVMEALNNALKHATPSAITITVTAEKTPDGSTPLRVIVADDGTGFDPTVAHPGHLGLSTMAERATAIGAALEVESVPGAGTRVTVRLPAAATGS